MKRFVQLTLIIALAVGAVSCKKDEIINTVKETPKDTPTVKELPPMQKITLSASSTKPGLRIAYDASRGTDVTDDNTLWQEGDEIAVYNVGVSGKPKRFVLVDGAGTSYGTFEGNIEPTGNYYGVYPYSAVRDQVLDGSSISIILPANQSYAEGSFGRDAAVFAATSTTEGDDVVLHFEPLLGYLSLSLTTPANSSRNTTTSIVGGHSVGSIVLHENSLGGVALSGNATIDMSGATPTLSAAQGGGLDVTLNCGSGVQLGSTPVEFIIAVPVGALSKGLCATVNDISGNKIMSLATTASNTITANIITKLLPAQDVYNIEDVEGRRYPVAKIGSQIWMGENFQCLKYDTNSKGYIDRGGEGASYVLPNQKDYSPYTTNDPQYVDPKDEDTWRENGAGSWAAGGIENVRRQKEHFGILYNWAAAFGFVTGDEAIAYDSGFDGPQMQGICPNGWHMPTWFEFFAENELAFYVNEGGARGDAADYCLRSVQGWLMRDGNIAGTDDFGFTALPAGSCGDGGSVTTNAEVGDVARFVSATPYGGQYFSITAVCNPVCNQPTQYNLFDYLLYPKQSFAAVRCLKD